MRITAVGQVGVLLFTFGCGSPGSNASAPDDGAVEAGLDAGASSDASSIASTSGMASHSAVTHGTGTGVNPVPTTPPEAGLGHDASLGDAGVPPQTDTDASSAATHDSPDTSAPVSSDSGVTPGVGDTAVDSGSETDDGGVNTGGVVPVVTCRVQTPLNVGTCEVTAGDAARLITGVILRPDDVLVGGEVLIDSNGVVTCSACDCSGAPGAATATQINCPSGVVSPGLINAHEHLTYGHQAAPLADTGERYDSRSEWRTGAGERPPLSVSAGASANQVRFSELRFLFGGATSILGSGGASGLLRNLDRSTTEGLATAAVDMDSFPLDDSSGMRRVNSCSYGSNPTIAQDFAGVPAFTTEVAAGGDVYAHNEFLCTSGLGSGSAPGNDLLTSRTSFVHAMALTASDYALMASRGSSLVWTPRSDFALYGNTAGIAQAMRLGLRIALGTEWLPTGSMNLLRELQCADSFNHLYLDDVLSDYQLWQMVTWNAARVAGAGDSVGALLPGRVGDIAIFDGRAREHHRAVLSAEPQDVVLVMRGGKALYGDAAVIAALPGVGACEELVACESNKLACLEGELGGQTWATLSSAMSAIYPALLCGTPDGEPTCVPSRPESVNGSTVYSGSATDADADGDGIVNAQDDCPSVFNPIRPMDDGVQPDADADGTGDACDVCPLATGTHCESSNPNDGDADAVVDWSDNCRDMTNASQADTDADGKGDACDLCPSVANPGAAACPVSIYDIKSGIVPTGTAVALTGAIVTGKRQQGFFVQVEESDADYQGPEYSGIFVALSDSAVSVGDRIAIATAKVAVFFGEIELTGVTGVSVLSSGGVAPAPVLAASDEVATGGVSVAALEGVIVQVEDATVTDVNPSVGTGDSSPTHEFVVDGALRVNDYFYLASPFPNLGQSFYSITGILRTANDHSKLEPRQASDLDGPASLSSFGAG